MTPELIEWPWSPEWTADGLPLQVERVSGTCRPHQHPFHEIALVASGAGRHRDAAGEAALRAGDLLVLHPQAWHAYPDGEGLHVYNCVFQPEVLAAISGLLAELGTCGDAVLRRHPRPLRQAPLRLRAGERERRELVRIFEQMIAERRGRRAGWRAALLAGLVQALALIGRLRAAEPPRAQPSDERIDAARRWLAERYRGPMPSLPALAARFGLSPGHLSRRFSARSGLGVVAFVHQLRIEEACRLLATTSAAVTTVGGRVGYDDPAYFARIFTRLVGCPPRIYRRRQAGLPGAGASEDAAPAPAPATPGVRMRLALLALILLCTGTLDALVVKLDGNGSDERWPTVTEPYSFGELDGNGDGKVDAAEWKSGRAQLERAIKETRAGIRDDLDTDESGKVSRYEAAEGKPRMATLWAQTKALAIAANDKDGDGKLLDAERKAVVTRITSLLNGFRARVDANGNGVVSKVEAEGAIVEVIEGKRKLFSICDRDNDGQLKNQEIDLAFNLMRAIAGD